MKLFLVRHGQTPNNLKNVYTGQTDVPLTELGVAQAEALRPILGKITFDKVFSSDLQRAINTQKIALPGVVGTPTPLLREILLGSLEGQPFEMAYADGNEERRRTRDFSPFGGETGAQIAARLEKFLGILEEDPCDYAIAFTHGGIITTMLRHIMGNDARFSAFKNGNCGIHIFEYDGKSWKLLAWNYMTEV